MAKGVYEKEPGSGVWWIRYADANGHIRREKAGTKSNATRLRHKRKQEALEGKLPELRKRRITFGQIAEAALAHSLKHKSSHKDDKSRMALLLEWFGDRPAETITPAEIDAKLSAEARARDWRPATSNRYRALLSLTFRLAVQNGQVKSNPARNVRSLDEKNARIRYLTPGEEARLTATIERDYPDRLPEFIIGLYTGMRASEQFGLTWDCVNMEQGVASIWQSKSGRPRHVSLSSKVLKAFEELRKRAQNGPVFRHPDGRPYKKPAREWFEAALRKSEIPDFTWHCLRHTFASRLVTAGVSLRAVQDLLGHQGIAMTLRYSHLAPEVGRSAVEQLSQWSEEKLSKVEDATGTKTDTQPKTARRRDAAVLQYSADEKQVI